MKVIFKEEPMVHEFQLFAGTKMFIEALREKRVLQVWTSRITKTRLSTSIQCGMASFNSDEQLGKFDFHVERRFNYGTGKDQVHAYFKLSKKQGREEYREYVQLIAEQVMRNFNVEIDEVHIFGNMFVLDKVEEVVNA